ncbi:MAG: ribosomal protein S18 acetylase RimI-like enzyme [Planctomycetaceae bacterium]|jgi:ribosomal protein S18 acetylase RimI-like enzyme
MPDRADIIFRPFEASDSDFVHYVFSSVRRDMLAGTGATGKKLDQLVREQSQLQLAHYQKFYNDAEHDIIELKGRKIGRIYVHRQEHEIRLMDISLLPEYRNKGIGSMLIQELLDEADQNGKKVSLHVESYNPARRLYVRLGFEKSEDGQVYDQMERKPVSADQSQMAE